MLKQVFILCILLLFSPCISPAQQADTLSRLPDSTTLKDSVPRKDTTLLKDSIISLKPVMPPVANTLDKLLEAHRFLNTKSKPLVFIQSARETNSRDVVFYWLAMLVLLFALLKFFYPRYFANLFQVFFNTSLRQSQLTDQLLQAKLPSLFFNIFFIMIGGWYLYLLLNYYGMINSYSRWQVLTGATCGLVIIYLLKFLILKFSGWVTGYRQEADTYIFIVFLINKIVAICLIPLVIIIAFAEKQLAQVAMILSFVIIGLMILMRFIRSYSLLQNRLKVSRFHFFIYITAVELVPILIIYKLAVLFISKKL